MIRIKCFRFVERLFCFPVEAEVQIGSSEVDPQVSPWLAQFKSSTNWLNGTTPITGITVIILGF